MQGRVTVFTSTACPHCLRAKNTLLELHIPYVEVPVDRYDKKVRESMVALAGGRTSVPQVFFNEVHVGGADDLQALAADAAGLKRLLAKVTNEPVGPHAPQLPADADRIDNNEVRYDEYAFVSWQIRQVPGLLAHRQLDDGRSLANAFQPRQLLRWLVDEKRLSEADALAMLHSLTTAGNRDAADKLNLDGYYQLLEDSDADTLNAGAVQEAAATADIGQLAQQIRQQIVALYAKHISPDGREVDYGSIAGDPLFAAYNSAARQLQRADLTGLAAVDDRLAFFVNLYNALMIHATVVLGPARTLWQRSKFFNTVSYLVGGHRFSLNDIEHGVLRANKLGVGSVHKQFGEGDPRLAYSLPAVDARVHFALNCGGKSCPPIRTYSAKDVHAELNVAARSFIEDEGNVLVKFDGDSGSLMSVSQIFDWYRTDFGRDGTDAQIVDFIAPFIGDQKKRTAIQAWVLAQGSGLKLGWLAYDWHLNEKQ